MAIKRILNAGAGTTAPRRILPLLQSHEWEEIRLDIDERVNPDIVGSVTRLTDLFPHDSYDAIWCSHMMEHLYAHEIHPTFLQFRQILKPTGFALVLSPDLEAVARHLLDHGIASVAYVSPSGPIRPLDMIYGHSKAIEDGRHYMAHRTGFTAERMGNLLLGAGFAEVSTRTEDFEIVALALMPEANRNLVHEELSRLGFNFTEAVD